MGREDLIGTDHPLTERQRRTLAVALDLIVPASEDGRKPSAAEVDVLGYIRSAEPETLSALGEQLDRLDAEAKARHGSDFAPLAAASRQTLVDDIRAREPRFLGTLALQTVACYYQDDRVLQALGMEARPPFPKGFDVPAGDLSLLDPVLQRGKLYREA